MKTEDVKNLYNQKIKDEYQHKYEFGRWFSSPIKKAGYDMTKAMIERYAVPQSCESYIEVGPGAGTWTKVFLEKFPNASYTLVDISEEMLKMSREVLSKIKDNVEYIEHDFLTFSSDNQCNMFFSSRAIEYMPDKKKAVETIAGLLKSGGKGFIITKTPKYMRAKLLRKKVSAFHADQISSRELTHLLAQAGMTDIAVYPVTLNFPLWESVGLSKLLFTLFSKLPLNPISQLVAESYCVSFRKP